MAGASSEGGMGKAKIRQREAHTTVYYCRHGVTDYPEDRFYPGGIEGGPELNREGQIQAERLAQYFSSPERLDACYVSPALRTRQTLEPIARLKNAPITVLPDLIERSMGDWDGRSAEEVQEADPEGWKRWKIDPLGFEPPRGESLTAFSQRVSKAVAQILEKEAGRTVVVVTHVGPIRVTVAAALEIPLANCRRLIVAPASVTRIHYAKSWPNLVLFGYQP